MKLQQFDQNKLGRDFVVGDIHGYFDLLKLKLISVNFDETKDRLFSEGDLIDRGPHSEKVLEWLEKPWFFAIKGNHEQMIYEYHNNIAWFHSYEGHGGKWAIDLPYEERQKYVDTLIKLPDVFEVSTCNGTIGIVHAEVPVKDWLEFKLYYDSRYQESALWSFDLLDDNLRNRRVFKVEYIDYIIHGHYGVKQPTQIENKIYIDTGKLSGKLCLLEINNPNGLITHH
jgi:serine/threonine protein phosphatase 1